MEKGWSMMVGGGDGKRRGEGAKLTEVIIWQ